MTTNNTKNQTPKELLEIIPDGTPKITITRSVGFTVNLQAYESARLDTTVTVEGKLENKELIEKFVNQEVESQIRNQIRELVEQHDTNKTLLGYRK